MSSQNGVYQGVATDYVDSNAWPQRKMPTWSKRLYDTPPTSPSTSKSDNSAEKVSGTSCHGQDRDPWHAYGGRFDPWQPRVARQDSNVEFTFGTRGQGWGRRSSWAPSTWDSWKGTSDWCSRRWQVNDWRSDGSFDDQARDWHQGRRTAWSSSAKSWRESEWEEDELDGGSTMASDS